MTVTVKQGEKFTLSATLKDSTGEPIPLAGTTVTLTVSPAFNRPVYFQIVQTTHVSPTTGQTTFPLTSENLADAGFYKYEVKVLFADGDEKKETGDFIIKPSLT